MRTRITRTIVFALVCLNLIAPQQQAHAEDLQISCSGGGSYTLVLPAGVVINGKTCTGALVIDNRARVIGKDAFSFSKVTSVQLPNSVVTIEASAFSYNSFTSISLGSSVESFGFEAFRMSKFTSISLPNSLKVIGECAFCDTYFSTIKLPDSLLSIGRNAFTRDDNPTPLISIEIPDSVKEIGVYAFANAKLETVKIGKSLKEIPFSAFRWNQLKSVTIPPNVTFIGASAFRDNPLESVSLSDGITGIDTEAFYGTKLVNLSIPDTVRGIGGKAFANISTLKTVTLSENFEQFRNTDNALWVGDVFEGSYGISEINYCGMMIGFLIQPVCTGAKKATIEAKAEADAKAKKEADAKAAAELKAKQDADAKAAAELKAKQEADAKVAAELKAKQEADAKAAAELKAKQEAEERSKIVSSFASLNLKFKSISSKYPQNQLVVFKVTLDRLNLAWNTGLTSYGLIEFEKSLNQLSILLSNFEAKNPTKSTINCVKGKLTKKVTAVNPVCPSGYKKK